MDESDDPEWFSQVVDFLKLEEAIRHQRVGFGHFSAILQQTSNAVQGLFAHYDSLFISDHIALIDQLKTLQNEYEVNCSSPLCIAFCANLSELDITPIYLISKVKKNYDSWERQMDLNPLPLLMSPEYVFNKKPLPSLFSPLPSYDIPDANENEIEIMLKETSDKSPQALLYLALLHAEQRKTSLALEEASQLCIRMSKSEDQSIRSRAAVALAQIYNIIGLKDDSILALNESIDGAKSLPDSSILSSAVAMKAQIEDTPEMWKHAAALANPHPEAIVHSIISEKGNISDALMKDWPYIAASVYATLDYEDSYRFALSLSLSIRMLPIVIEPLAKGGEWKKAAMIIQSKDIGFAEVRSTALALGTLYYDVYGKQELSNEMRTELNDILNIDIGHFGEVKGIVQRIADAFQVAIDKDKLPNKESLLYGVKWSVLNANNAETTISSAILASKVGAGSLWQTIKEKAEKYHVTIEEPEPKPIQEKPEKYYIEIEELINALAES